jgi:predicted rRNA methylase YqxC with S4 and FtsJ domains
VLLLKTHLRVINNIIESANEYDLHLNKLDYSPIKGEKAGNIEYLGMFTFKGNDISKVDISNIIDEAFKKLK